MLFVLPVKNIFYTTFIQLYNFFLRLIIEYLRPTCRKTNLIIDKKKKKK